MLKSVPLRIGAGAIALVLLLDVLGYISPRLDLLRRLEWMTYDWRMRLASQVPRESAPNLGFVFISDETVEVISHGDLSTNYLQYGLYWPRHIYGRLINELSAQGARAIGLDVLFAEKREDQNQLATGTNLSPDRYFAEELRRAGNVVLAATSGVIPASVFRTNALALGSIETVRDRDGVLRRTRAFQNVRIWNEKIREQARLSGWDLPKALVTSEKIVFFGRTNSLELLVTDGLFDPFELVQQKPPSGVVRLEQAFEDNRVWHLGIVLAAIRLGLDLEKADVDLARGRIVLSSTNGNQRVLPVDREGEFLIDWRIKANDYRHLTQSSFEVVLSDHILRQIGTKVTPRFRDKLVMVGSVAEGVELSDRGATPLEENTFLTSSYWNVINSVITGRFISVVPRWVDVLLICLFGAGASVLARKLPTTRASISAVLLAATYVGTATGLFVFARFWVPLVAPLLSLAAGYVGLVAYQAFFEETEKRRIREVFSKFVSPTVVQKLLKSESVSLTGERRHVTVLFADIRGFTEATDGSHARAEERIRREKLTGGEAEDAFDRESQEVLNTVNLYLSTIADTVKKHGGTLDKFIGDCVMAFWGAPVDDERHAVSCVRAAIESQRALHRLNEERRHENARRERANFEKLALGQTLALAPMLQILSVGTGINTGMVVAGLMGSQDAHNYTIFGRDVNVASRLENLSGSARILIGEATYFELKKHEPGLAETCIELPPAEIRGIREALKIYEVPWK